MGVIHCEGCEYEGMPDWRGRRCPGVPERADLRDLAALAALAHLRAIVKAASEGEGPLDEAVANARLALCSPDAQRWVPKERADLAAAMRRAATKGWAVEVSTDDLDAGMLAVQVVGGEGDWHEALCSTTAAAVAWLDALAPPKEGE